MSSGPILREAYRRTRNDRAVGVDGQTAEAYAEDLDENLTFLPDRFKAGTYHAPARAASLHPQRGRYCPRPIGIPTFEDKVLQRAVAMVLEAVYEQDFLDCSYYQVSTLVNHASVDHPELIKPERERNRW